MVDLGAGNGIKIKMLVETAVKEEHEFEYIPIDISHSSNLILADTVAKVSPHLKATLLTASYEQGVEWVRANKKDRNFFTFIGNSISNFRDADKEQFFEKLKACLKKGDMLLIGVDLKKDPHLINKAYNSDIALSKAVTLNNLARINRELEGNFNLENFFTDSHYNPLAGQN